MDDVDANLRSDAVANQNIYNLRLQYRIAMQDISQRFTASWTYQLPFGSKGKLAAGVPVVHSIVADWQLAGIVQFQMGYPYNVTQTNTMGLFSLIQYPNAVGNPNLSSHSVSEWFNTQAFALAPPNTLGDSPQASFFGPGQNNRDLGIGRSFPIRERVRFQIRTEAFNAFNHPQWSNLGTNLSSPGTFGRVTLAMDPRTVQVVGRLSF
jgi:hypothetical protein